MEELYNTLVKLGPAWTVVVIAGFTLASLIFLLTQSRYRKMRDEAYAGALKLKDDYANDLKVRIKEIETERNDYREKSHLSAQATHEMGLKLADERSKPNVDSLARLLQEWRTEFMVFCREQSKINESMLTALSKLVDK